MIPVKKDNTSCCWDAPGSLPFSLALVGLSTGDIASMAYNMQVAFATTVVGLFSAAIGFVTKQTKKMIQAVKKAGFNAIRIPIRWQCHITNAQAMNDKVIRHAKVAVGQ